MNSHIHHSKPSSLDRLQEPIDRASTPGNDVARTSRSEVRDGTAAAGIQRSAECRNEPSRISSATTIWHDPHHISCRPVVWGKGRSRTLIPEAVVTQPLSIQSKSPLSKAVKYLPFCGSRVHALRALIAEVHESHPRGIRRAV